ncbi:50S ribosomal protein L32 [Candidatus Woesebacteria bacterium CG_4_10_14_0_2_um_filter_39_14]|uniref:Large ribosomal subunit protein bL32 n=2 Tax=Candidatus Woeseibacteriota TaxID=1752722 RepID=A0A2M7TJR4_9BACT|nr:MAG: 50S ribosomal protein L32 [Candidatus Woesebacteria bacterium CG_4_10_14_0_2_um_filter_39_14]
MTPVPKKKHTRSRSNIRRNASFKLKLANLIRCPHCKKLMFPHRDCPSCGKSYKK